MPGDGDGDGWCIGERCSACCGDKIFEICCCCDGFDEIDEFEGDGEGTGIDTDELVAFRRFAFGLTKWPLCINIELVASPWG